MAISSFYRTPPLGPQDQPDYLNAAVVLDTALDAETFSLITQRIELQQGRVRKAERWGPRPLDLDIMLFGNEVINTSPDGAALRHEKSRLCSGRCLKSPPTSPSRTASRSGRSLDNLHAEKPARW